MSRITLKDIAKKAGVSISTVSRAINRPDMVKKSTRDKVLKVVKEIGYKPKVSRRITLNDIAKIAGVSRSTVSRTLNHPEKVKTSTRNKVLKVIKKVGYKPKIRKKGLVSRETTVVRSRKINLNDIAKLVGVSRSTVSRALNRPEKVKESTRIKILKVINEINYKPVNVTEKYLEYKNFMATKPNDTVHKRWGMYTHDKRYKDYTASIVKMIMDDMKINVDQAYYMLYYMVSNDINDYERAKRDMMVDPNFEIYRTRINKR